MIPNEQPTPLWKLILHGALIVAAAIVAGALVVSVLEFIEAVTAWLG